MGQWLAQIAANFDTYEILSLKFKFRTACSTLTSGLVMFAYDPNPEGSPPKNYGELRNMFSCDGTAHNNLEFDVTQRCKKKQLLVRKGGVINLPSYDNGKVYFATIGVNASTLVGFVDVEYKVRLSSPQSGTSVIAPDYGQVVKPVQRITFTGNDATPVNAAIDFAQVISKGLAGGVELTGAPLATVYSRNFLPLDLTVAGGYKFTRAEGWATVFDIAKAGRYNIKYRSGVDFEDTKLFAIMPFYIEDGGALMQRCTYPVYTSIEGGTPYNMPVFPISTRGFTGTGVGDPNPATEVQREYSWDVNIMEDRHCLTIGVGVMTYNNVSTTTAVVRYIQNCGLSVIELTYLGPLLPPLT